VIKAIIFDCFGVLVTEGFTALRQEYFENDYEKLSQVHDISRRLNLGQISYDDSVKETAALAGIKEADVRSYIDQNHPNQPLFALVKEQLKPKYKIGMLSNAGADWLSELFTPQQLEYFDATVLSYQTGFIKPQSEIYKLAAEILNVEPEECVFVDDSEGHCSAAALANMKAIWYRDFSQFKTELDDILSHS